MDTTLSTKGAQLLLLKKNQVTKARVFSKTNIFHSKYSSIFWSPNDIHQCLKSHYSPSLGSHQVQLNQRRRKSHFSSEKKEEKGKESWASFPFWKKCTSEERAAMGSWGSLISRQAPAPARKGAEHSWAWLGSAGIFHSLPSPALNLAC